MKRLQLVVVVAIWTLLGACGEVEAGRVEVGRAAPAYAATNLEGDTIQLSSLGGRVVLLNVWATWCLPCREEMPALQELFEGYGPRGFEVVGVSVDGRGDRAAIRRFVEDYGLTFTIWHDPDDVVMSRFRVIGVPATYLIDREGVLRWRHMGPVTADDPSLLAALEEALTAT